MKKITSELLMNIGFECNGLPFWIKVEYIRFSGGAECYAWSIWKNQKEVERDFETGFGSSLSALSEASSALNLICIEGDYVDDDDGFGSEFTVTSVSHHSKHLIVRDWLGGVK